MKNSVYIESCIKYKIPVVITGWEELGPVVLLQVEYNEFGDFHVATYETQNEPKFTDTAVLTPEWLERAIVPCTKAGEILFGHKDLTNEEE